MKYDLEHFTGYLTVECGLSRNTIAAYTRDVAQFISFCGREGYRDFSDVSEENIITFLLEEREKGKKDSSVARMLVSVRIFFAFLFIHDIVKKDVSAMLEGPKIDKKLPSVLTEAQVKEILIAPDPEQDTYYRRDRAVLELLYGSGLRVSELCSLKRNAVNYREGSVRVLGKGAKERIVPVGRKAAESILLYLEEGRPEPKDNYLFVTRSGHGMDREMIWEMVKKYAARSGVKSNVSPHTFRHCFATHLVEHGANLRAVQVMLGHENISTTEIYTHVDASRLKKIHEQAHPRGREENG